MAQTNISITHSRASDYKGNATDSVRLVVQKLCTFLNGLGGALYAGTTLLVSQVQASGTLTFSSASGTVGGSINGVAITVSASGGDGATGDAWAAAVNASANALVSGLVTASSNGAGVVTVTSVPAGPIGNAQTLAASGTGVTASGARLTGGTATSYTL